MFKSRDPKGDLEEHHLTFKDAKAHAELLYNYHLSAGSSIDYKIQSDTLDFISTGDSNSSVTGVGRRSSIFPHVLKLNDDKTYKVYWVVGDALPESEKH